MPPKVTRKPEPKPETTTTPKPTKDQPVPKTGVEGKAEVKGLQTTLDFWKMKCQDGNERHPISSKVLEGRKPARVLKENAVTITKRKGKRTNFSPIQGQLGIKSFLERKNNSMTPSVNFQNSSVSNDNYTTVADSCEIYVGNKTTEAENKTGGETEQLQGTTNLKNYFERKDTIGQN